MIHPSYVDLMNVVNKDAKEGETPIINSRYSIVMATAKRARQIVQGDAPMVDEPEGRKPLSIAVDELQQEALKILPQDEEEILHRELEEILAAKAKAQESEIARLARNDADQESEGAEDENAEAAEQE